MPLTIRLAALILLLGAACRHAKVNCPTPTETGFNTRDLIDPPAQKEAEELAPADQISAAAENLRKERQRRLEDQSKKEGGASKTRPERGTSSASRAAGRSGRIRRASSMAGPRRATGRSSTWSRASRRGR